jgi:P2 family phage major capsid protein
MAKGHQLSAAGRLRVDQFIQQIGQVYGVDATRQFTVTPSIAQELQPLITLDGAPFLQMINVIGVSELKGEKIFMDVSGLVSKRTDTDDNDRVPTDPSSLDKKGYELFPVETDVAIKYATIDAWAKFPNFAAMWNGLVRKAIANDRLRVGWHGLSNATPTVPATYPNGEDVNIGWLKQIRDYNSGSQYVDGSGGAVVVGSDDFPNLDYLVSVTKARIDPVFRNSPDLVAIISQNLASNEEAEYFRKSGRDSEKKDALLSENRLMKNYGGLPSYSPPFLMDGVILVTSLTNLSIYYQDTSWRRLIRDWAPRNRYEDFTSRNEGYVVEDFRKTSLVDGVTTETDSSTLP